MVTGLAAFEDSRSAAEMAGNQNMTVADCTTWCAYGQRVSGLRDTIYYQSVKLMGTRVYMYHSFGGKFEVHRHKRFSFPNIVRHVLVCVDSAVDLNRERKF